MSRSFLVLNAGSSSLKFSLFDNPIAAELALALRGELQQLYGHSRFRVRDASDQVVAEKVWDSPLRHEGAVDHLLAWLRTETAGQKIVGAGHRVVHGGTHYAAPERVTAALVADLETLVPLAPLHQPHNLLPMKILLDHAPELAQVACFDTAFHRTRPEIEQTFALAPEWTERGVRRYGFHGTSYEYIASVLSQYDERAAKGRTVVMHLGNGASMCALSNSRSMATTMGFTPTDGLMMGTRCGSLDPGVVLYFAEQHGMHPKAIRELLNQHSGLLGVSGISSDLRTLEASKEPAARFALEMFCYRIRRELGALAAVLSGLDALVFTAGIGENSRWIRERVCQDAAWLGVDFDPDANAANGPRMSSKDSAVSVWIIPTDEERMIALHTLKKISESAASG